MPDTIGRISVPAPVNSGQTFPLVSNFPFGFSQERPIIVHRFGSGDAKIEQRFQVGMGPRKFQFRRANLNYADRHSLADFWEPMQGIWSSFIYTVPNADGTTSPTNVIFENQPLSFQHLRNAVQVGLTFVEIFDPSTAPTYAVTSTCLRFPSSTLQAALLAQVQQIIPLVHIRVREGMTAPAWQAGTAYAACTVVNYGSPAIPYVAVDANTGNEPDTSPAHWRPFDIYLSDRRVTIGSQLYLPRLLDIGDPKSGVLLSQNLNGSADNVSFTLGNADRVMTQLANNTDLKYAQIAGHARLAAALQLGMTEVPTIVLAHLTAARIAPRDSVIPSANGRRTRRCRSEGPAMETGISSEGGRL
jgi:hypothetical protein